MPQSDVKKIPPKYFLETTVQYKRVLGTDRERDYIDKIIGDSVIYCSFFILLEFHRIFTTALIEFLDYLEQYRDVVQAIKEFRKDKAFQGTRKNALIELLTYNVITYGKEVNKARGRVILILREEEKKFVEIVSRWINHADYQKLLVNDFESSLLDDFHRKVSEEVGSLGKFFRLRKGKLEVLIQKGDGYLGNVSKKDKKDEFMELKKIYHKLINEEDILNKTNIGKLSDTIIALESPSTCCLLTYDEIFKILCPALEKNHKLLGQLPTLKKLKKGGKHPVLISS